MGNGERKGREWAIRSGAALSGSVVFSVTFIAILVLAVFPCPSLTPVPSASAETRERPDRDQKVTFNFVDVDLTAVTKFISEITRKNFIYDERVKGKITIIAPSKLSVEDAYALFTSVLEMKGFTVVPSGVDAYKIIPLAEAKQKGLRVGKEKQPVNEGYIARLIRLQNIASDDALKLLLPVVSKDGYISAFGPGNMLLVIDSGLNIEKVLSIIEVIDQPSSMEEPALVFLKNSSADAVAKVLNEGMGRRQQTTIPQAAAGEVARAVADTRLNAVILFGDRGTKESMKSLIAHLDAPSPEALGRINVYFLENADAVELAKVLEGMLKAIQPVKQAVQGAPAVTPFEAAGGISVTADKATNSLVIVASPSDYQNFAQIVRQLDRRRRQVFVEAMIAEVSIDGLLELGAKWRGTVTVDDKPIFVGGVGSVDSSTIQSIVSGLSGLTLGGLGSYYTIPQSFISGATSDVTTPGLAAIFNLNDFKDVVNVLSTPQILTADNREAEIVVGENVPFISKREITSTSTTSYVPTTSIERQDVGIKLKITPQITEGTYVKLDIYQEISSVKQDSETILTTIGPTTTKRSTKTSVVVRDKETVVIGGLMQERNEDSLTKVPFFGDIPLLGWLFKNKSTSKKKTNLLVFITPHVIKEGESLSRLTRDKQRVFAAADESIYTEDVLLVRFREGVSDARAREIISSKDASALQVIEGPEREYYIKIGKGKKTQDAAAEFSALPEVKNAEPVRNAKGSRAK
ncbi:MAG: type II secretion system secretin GspD [Alphaproteobacteria bacterium]|uniref:Type II secretion system secretin GspD n=1 Tax=Candidatus Nitrobium versatile TaxID=2884831 RepID=A0A953LV93_9BACT|nr:type II secretion system secretin GspD [Candidatus Nitrobium versatile]